MSDYPQLATQLARALTNAPNQALDVQEANASALIPEVVALIDAFPYYGDPNLTLAHQGAISNLLQVYLPNSTVQPQPGQYGFGYTVNFTYNGPYAGYRDAFYPGVVLSSSAATVASEVAAASILTNEAWWVGLSVPVLTHAITMGAGVGINGAALQGILTVENGLFFSVLSASYLGVFKNGYASTTAALNTIVSKNLTSDALNSLDSAIKNGHFTANINQTIGLGGDDTNASTWFLYNLWISLKVLGATDVDELINGYTAAGLIVPDEVAANNWWVGAYRSWFSPITGAYVANAAHGGILAGMPETSLEASPGTGLPSTSYPILANGYSQSFCLWGSDSNFKPVDSCVGARTGILMADGSSKHAKDVTVGEEVQTTVGPRKVVLVEAPPRAGRSLYQINGQEVFLTPAHPVRSTTTDGPMRRAVDPWALADALPTMTPDGIGALAEGTVLQGHSGGSVACVPVAHITEHAAPTGPADECVYDLVLENWEKDYPAYFVGGPDTFIAVDNESPDASYNLPTSVAVATAVDTVLPICRSFAGDQTATIASIMNGIDATYLIKAGQSAMTGRRALAVPKDMIPGADYYMVDGAWDPHASVLEHYFVKYFGRLFRSECALGWRSSAAPVAPGHHLTLTIRDLYRVGEVPFPNDAVMSLVFEMRAGPHLATATQCLTIAAPKKPTWNRHLDAVVDFGTIEEGYGEAILIGRVTVGDTPFGVFQAYAAASNLDGRPRDFFIFDEAANVVGRAFIDFRANVAADLNREPIARENWRGRHQFHMARALGRQFGLHVAAKLEAVGVRHQDR